MYEQRESDDPRIRLVWRAGGADDDGVFVDAANECWGLGFTRRADGTLLAELCGPAAEARPMRWHAGDLYWGVDLESHVFWRGLDKTAVLGDLRPLPVDGDFVELGGVRYPVPDHDDLETLVATMAAQGVLVSDPLVAEALRGSTSPTDAPATERTLQRRFRAATGLGRKRIEQIERARAAYRMLQEGRTPAEVAVEAGYADQAHLTRSLRVFAGQTPREILLGVS